MTCNFSKTQHSKSSINLSYFQIILLNTPAFCNQPKERAEHSIMSLLKFQILAVPLVLTVGAHWLYLIPRVPTASFDFPSWHSFLFPTSTPAVLVLSSHTRRLYQRDTFLSSHTHRVFKTQEPGKENQVPLKDEQ